MDDGITWVTINSLSTWMKTRFAHSFSSFTAYALLSFREKTPFPSDIERMNRQKEEKQSFTQHKIWALQCNYALYGAYLAFQSPRRLAKIGITPLKVLDEPGSSCS